MPEMISSPDFSSEPNFMAQYMSNMARAGVIVNSAFPNLDPGEDVQTLRPPSALSGARVPTPFSGSSSLLSEDSFEHQHPFHKPPPHKLDHAGYISLHRDPDWEGSRSRPLSRAMFREEDVLREELNDPLLKKLEQGRKSTPAQEPLQEEKKRMLSYEDGIHQTRSAMPIRRDRPGFFKVATFCFDDCFAHFWHSLDELQEVVTRNGLPTVLKEFPEMLSTCWPFCLHSAVQLTPNHLDWVQYMPVQSNLALCRHVLRKTENELQSNIAASMQPAGKERVNQTPENSAHMTQNQSRQIQLKEMQQQKQEQLKQQQMEQLHKLMEEQKMLLNLVSRQPPYSEHEQQSLISGQVGSSMSPKHPSRLMSPVSGNIPRDSAYKRQELLAKDRSPSRPPSLSVRELSPEKSKTLEELLNEEDAEDYSGDELESEDSSQGEDSSRVLRELHNRSNSEDRPIESSIKERNKSFEQFLEEQMTIEEQRLKETNLQQAIEEQSKSKHAAKRPFLRKGEGIARFKNAPKKQIKHQENKGNPQKVSEVTISQKVEKVPVQRKIAPLIKDQTSDTGSGLSKTTVLPAGEKNEATQKKVILKSHNIKHNVSSSTAHGQPGEKTTLSGVRPVTVERKSMLELDKENVGGTMSTAANKPGNKVHDGDSKTADLAEMSFEISFQKRAVNWEKEKTKERYELDEFLLLEQAAEELSFSSNSSFVQKLLDQNFQSDSRRLSSTPVKSAEKHLEKAGNSERTTGGGKLFQKMEVQGSLSKITRNIVLPDQSGKNSSALHRTSKEAKKSHTSDPVSSEGDYASSGDEHSNSVSSENEDLDSDGSMKDEGPITDHLEGLPKRLNRDGNGRDFDLDLSDGEGNDSKEKTLLAEDSKGDDDSSSSDSSQIVFDDERTWDDLGNVQSLQGVFESNFATKQFIPSEYTSNSTTDALDKAITRKVASKNGDQLKAATISTPDTPPASELMMKLFPALKPKGKPDGSSVTKPTSSQEGPGKNIGTNFSTI
ncbi:unnamed protein product [Ranitomeya imitator]|uniref:CENPJ tubulin-binding region domain-containing protein n=1 Tax=Ranitomeya imitator TaxID=111125 RepID=A0ABN9LLX3_9NEOB|nr:unnamed protein product [Ranitomeya imitator]